MKRKLLFLSATALLLGLAGCGQEEQLLDPDKPVTLTIWHYYNGAQQTAFDSLVDEFNETEGREKGVFIQSASQGAVDSLEAAVRASINEEVGSQEMPDIFSSYADTAYEVKEQGMLADISGYFTEEELDEYVDSYIEEGRLSEEEGLWIFPVAKATEIMMLNKTDWDLFAEATGATLDSLATLEGVAGTAQDYYNWTDEQTPEVPNDGKAFYGRDSMGNYFIIGMRQLGKEIFDSSDGSVTLNLDREDLYRLWENYYVPYVKGYYAAYGKFRSDDVKTGDLLAFTGSATASMYFPDNVELGENSYPIEYMVLPAPVLEDGQPYMVQQGAGMVVTKSDESHEYAACVFLKWFTRSENNLKFACASGYLPVKKEALSVEKLDEAISAEDIQISPKTYDCLTSIIQTARPEYLYTNRAFKQGYPARKVLDYNLSDKAAADRAQVEAQLSGGAALEDACAPYISEEAFDSWYEDFCGALREAVGE